MHVFPFVVTVGGAMRHDAVLYLCHFAERLFYFFIYDKHNMTITIYI